MDHHERTAPVSRIAKQSCGAVKKVGGLSLSLSLFSLSLSPLSLSAFQLSDCSRRKRKDAASNSRFQETNQTRRDLVRHGVGSAALAGPGQVGKDTPRQVPGSSKEVRKHLILFLSPRGWAVQVRGVDEVPRARGKCEPQTTGGRRDRALRLLSTTKPCSIGPVA